jgi:hypothetical protein
MEMGIPHHAAHSKSEVDNIVLDEAVRGVASLVERLEGQLRAALGDNHQASVLVEILSRELQQVCPSTAPRNELTLRRREKMHGGWVSKWRGQKKAMICFEDSLEMFRLRLM